MDYENVESNEVADITVYARSFCWTVDNMIKSSSDSEEDLGESPVHSFNSLINSAIRSSSDSEEDLGASPLHTFASAVDMRTIGASFINRFKRTRIGNGERRNWLLAVQKKVRVLRLVPCCRKDSFPFLLNETTDYISALEMQVRVMEALAKLMAGAAPESLAGGALS